MAWDLLQDTRRPATPAQVTGLAEPPATRGETNINRSKPSPTWGKLEPMASRDQINPERRHYGDHRPYPDPPARLTDLTGPTQGTIDLPVTIDWGPKRTYNMAIDADRRVVYELVLQEAGSTEEVSQYVNGQVLAKVWAQLWLPRRIRNTWEERLPELGRAA
jgi:hypothetical protein